MFCTVYDRNGKLLQNINNAQSVSIDKLSRLTVSTNKETFFYHENGNLHEHCLDDDYETTTSYSSDMKYCIEVKTIKG